MLIDTLLYLIIWHDCISIILYIFAFLTYNNSKQLMANEEDKQGYNYGGKIKGDKLIWNLKDWREQAFLRLGGSEFHNLEAV